MQTRDSGGYSLFPGDVTSYTFYLTAEPAFHHFERLLDGTSVFQVIGAMLKDTTINIDAMPCKGTSVDRQTPPDSRCGPSYYRL